MQKYKLQPILFYQIFRLISPTKIQVMEQRKVNRLINEVITLAAGAIENTKQPKLDAAQQLKYLVSFMPELLNMVGLIKKASIEEIQEHKRKYFSLFCKQEQMKIYQKEQLKIIEEFIRRQSVSKSTIIGYKGKISIAKHKIQVLEKEKQEIKQQEQFQAQCEQESLNPSQITPPNTIDRSTQTQQQDIRSIIGPIVRELSRIGSATLEQSQEILQPYDAGNEELEIVRNQLRFYQERVQELQEQLQAQITSKYAQIQSKQSALALVKQRTNEVIQLQRKNYELQMQQYNRNRQTKIRQLRASQQV